MVFVFAISFYTTRAVLQVLGIENYGIYNVVCGFVSMFAVFNTAFSSSIVRFYNDSIGRGDESDLSRTFSTAIVIQATLSIIVILLVEFIGLWYVTTKMVIPLDKLHTAKIIFHFSVAAMGLTILQAPFSALILAKEKIGYYALVSVLSSALSLCNVFILKCLPFDKLLLYGILCFLISVTVFVLYSSFVKIKFKEARFSMNLDRGLFRKMVSFSGWTILDPIAYTMRGQGCNMVLNSFFGPVVNAAYSLSNQIANALDQFTGNISTAFTPQLQQSFSSGNENRALSLTFSMSKINFILQMTISLPLIFEMDYVLHLWLKDSIPDYTVMFATYTILVNTINTLQNPLTRLIQATGEIRSYMVFASFLTALTLPVGYLLLRCGYDAGSLYIGMLSITAINLFVCLFITSRKVRSLSFTKYLKVILLPCVFCSLLTGSVVAVPSLIMRASIFRLLISCSVSVIASVFFSIIIVLNVDERRMMVQYINDILSRMKY